MPGDAPNAPNSLDVLHVADVLGAHALAGRSAPPLVEPTP